ncbi:MAG TPA: amylo-alpha-1,6-glucosidase [Kofleriaceae bacterium]|nr:amylo-alpha-1,6-glucosidase [Kofleriaceae bacterium]
MISLPVPRRSVAVGGDPQRQHSREWLVGNGLGGYASGTIGGCPTRRYHGLLIASLPNPAGRVMMLNGLAEVIRLPDHSRRDLGWVESTFSAGRCLELVELELELGLPVWRFRGDGVAIERRVAMAYGHNTTVVTYRLLEGGPVRLEIRPALQFRGHDEPVSKAVPAAYPLHAVGSRIEIAAPEPLPGLRLHLAGARPSFVIEPRAVPDIAYVVEEHRGYASRGQLYSPGRFRADLLPGGTVAFVASTEPWETVMTMTAAETIAAERDRRQRLLEHAAPQTRGHAACAELVLAADAFVVRPAGRHEDHVRARVAGDEAWTVVAGYHWFTDWGRDSMISLQGLTLCTGRLAEAGSILRMFAHHVRDGLVPNLFPEGANEGLYHTADATLWFFHAIDRYVRASHDEHTLAQLIPVLRSIIEHHQRGTRFGIGVDPADGLLRQGAEGYQLTWMDAKAGDWVVTPRRGKAVEINALWYNALRLMERWLDQLGEPGAAEMTAAADRAYAAFQRRFWNPATGGLFDVVDGEAGDDPACRPNQIFAISLPHPVLASEHWASVLEVVERELLTPVGLRSLSRSHPEYKRNYHGDLLTRDAAYHQGTVWSWLIGPYIDALLRVRPDDIAGARRALDGLIAHLGEGCIGSVGEVFDAEEPFTPGGCVAQAWGVAELLRCLLSVEAAGAETS